MHTDQPVWSGTVCTNPLRIGIFPLQDYSGHTTLSTLEANWSQISIHTAPEVTKWELLLFNKQITDHLVLSLYFGNVVLLCEKKIKHACFEVAN